MIQLGDKLHAYHTSNEIIFNLPSYTFLSLSMTSAKASVIWPQYTTFKNIYLFIWVGEREERERKREKRILGRLPMECGVECWARSHNPEIMTQTDTKSQKLNRLSHTGTLNSYLFFQSGFSGMPCLNGVSYRSPHTSYFKLVSLICPV